MRIRLTVMNFLQFFVWGTWLTSLGVYLDRSLHFEGGQIAGIFSTMGIAALVMPALLGTIADRWINAERILSGCHILGGCILFCLTTITQYNDFFWLMLLYAILYMPTLSLSNSIAFSCLKDKGYDAVKAFPPIRVWGTIGFIFAMWLIDLLKWTSTNYQLYLAAIVSVLYGLYALSLPTCLPSGSLIKKKTVLTSFGLDALSLFKEKRMSVFLIFSMLLGAALQITNTFGQAYLRDFGQLPEYETSFAVLHPGILTSVSQLSEALFILAIPFFLRKFGIKGVMLMSMAAWVLRFALFGIGNPGHGFIFLILSMVVYGMAFDFFQVSGSLFIEKESPLGIKASAQGLFVLMVNGSGIIVGTKGSGWVVDYYTNADGVKDWQSIWMSFAVYALLLSLLFFLLFKVPKRNG